MSAYAKLLDEPLTPARRKLALAVLQVCRVTDHLERSEGIDEAPVLSSRKVRVRERDVEAAIDDEEALAKATQRWRNAAIAELLGDYE